MMFTTAKNIEKVVRKIQLAVGGAVFELSPELLTKITDKPMKEKTRHFRPHH